MKSCLVVVDAPGGPWTHTLSAAENATIEELLQLARELCPAPDVAWADAAVGVHGTRRERSYVPADGDRVELYRQLLADPRERRRQRVSSRRRGPAPNAR